MALKDHLKNAKVRVEGRDVYISGDVTKEEVERAMAKTLGHPVTLTEAKACWCGCGRSLKEEA